ncbi:MAG: VOC family protein [Streptosporangiaceae bacterium]|jgi:4a-hydroxytetrahydrobiopterin dehydratase
MGQDRYDQDRTLSRAEASHAVTGLGWRYVLGEVRTEVLTGSLPLAADVAGRVAALPHAQGHLRMDIRADRLLLALQTAVVDGVTSRDVELAKQISALTEEFRLSTQAGAGQDAQSVQVLEIAIDVLDGAKVRPFWRAALGYVDQPGPAGPLHGLIDPRGQGPAFWFQQLDAPRPQRNRIHVDITVPHDEAHQRIGDTIAAGGTLVSDAEAPAFWILADPEGNEACICTWQGRDPGSTRGPEQG